MRKEDLQTPFIGTLVPLYGPAKAGQVASVILPAFLKDFEKSLGQAQTGTEVTETYRTEDEKAVIALTGMRRFGPKGTENVLFRLTVTGDGVGREVLGDEEEVLL